MSPFDMPAYLCLVATSRRESCPPPWRRGLPCLAHPIHRTDTLATAGEQSVQMTPSQARGSIWGDSVQRGLRVCSAWQGAVLGCLCCGCTPKGWPFGRWMTARPRLKRRARVSDSPARMSFFKRLTVEIVAPLLLPHPEGYGNLGSRMGGRRDLECYEETYSKILCLIFFPWRSFYIPSMERIPLRFFMLDRQWQAAATSRKVVKECHSACMCWEEKGGGAALIVSAY